MDLNANGVYNAGEPFDLTDATGAYDIDTFVAAGTYRVNQVVKPRWTQTYPAVGGHLMTISQRGDVITGLDFGNLPMPGGVSGVKWNDLDGDGTQDPNEPGVAGVYIYADMDGSGTIAIGEPAAVTAADGSYVINGIPAGSVAIREVQEPWLGAHLSGARLPPDRRRTDGEHPECRFRKHDRLRLR